MKNRKIYHLKNYHKIGLLVFACGFQLIAQQSWKSPEVIKRELDTKYRLAIQYEQQGQIDRALDIYRYLFDQDPANTNYYSRFTYRLFELKNYDRLEHVISTYLRYKPKDETALVDLGKLYFSRGDTVLAEQHWENYWKVGKYSQSYTRSLFNCLISLRQYDRAEEVIVIAREYYGKEDLFAIELANFQMMRGNYIKSTQEYLIYGRQNHRNYQFAGNQILRFPNDSSLFVQIDSLIQLEISQTKGIPELYELRADLLFRFKHYDTAVEQTMIVESLRDNKGNTVLDLAADLLNIGEFTLAEQLYTTIIKKPEFRGAVPKALLGLADAFEKEMLAEQKYSPFDYFYRDNFFFVPEYIYGVDAGDYYIGRAFSIYDSVIVTLPKSAYTAKALYRLAELRFRILHDIDGAERLYTDALKSGLDTETRNQCIVRQVDLLIARGELKELQPYIRKNRAKYEGQTVEKLLALRYLLGLYYQGELDSLLTYSNDLLGLLGVSDPYFNDVIELQNFIEQFLVSGNSENRSAVRDYLKSELLIRQSKLSEAREVLTYLLENYKDTEIALPARYRLLQIDLFFSDREQAEMTLSFILSGGNQFADDALYMMGELAQFRDRDTQYAARWYQILLEQYPNSFMKDEIRKRLRSMPAAPQNAQEL
ncbi:MAG: tetratricopeptide repeat protein [Candidatus Marinimicrobia bacterium]|nr:tetratricopeptide repeat protein [Candidatus Neomarinimicrobiota bacterium]